MRLFIDPPVKSGQQTDDPPYSAGCKFVDPPLVRQKVQLCCWSNFHNKLSCNCDRGNLDNLGLMLLQIYLFVCLKSPLCSVATKEWSPQNKVSKLSDPPHRFIRPLAPIVNDMSLKWVIKFQLPLYGHLLLGRFSPLGLYTPLILINRLQFQWW